MRTSSWTHLVLAVAVLPMAASAKAGMSRSGPLDLFAPTITLSQDERRRLDNGQVVVKRLSGGRAQLAVLAVTHIKASPDALVAWTREIQEFKRSRFVLALQELSEPPRLEDFARLELDDDDLEALRSCVPGDCDLKLSAPEIDTIRRAIASAGAQWKIAAQDGFRRAVLARVTLYRNGGLAALPPIADEGKPRPLTEAFTAILTDSPYLANIPGALAWLKGEDVTGAVESFFYWSKEAYGSGKPVVTITHVGILRPSSGAFAGAAVVLGKQIFATHYMDGSLGLTAIVDGEPGQPAYFVYVNRSHVDVLTGMFGPLVRRIMAGRLTRDTPEIIRGLRSRLEGGLPPAAR